MATIYAQPVECQFIHDMQVLRPIQISEEESLTFPESMVTCHQFTTGDFDLQVGALSPDSDFKKLSHPVHIFE